jgi:hypothetical protein
MKKIFSIIAFMACILHSGCEKKPPVLSPESQTEAKTQVQESSVPVSSSGNAVIRGKVRLDGNPPAPAMLSIAGNPECVSLHAKDQIPA